MSTTVDLLVMGPHSEDLHRPFRVQDLVDQTMLDVDSPREGALEVADQLFKGRRALSWIPAEEFQQLLRFLAKPAPRDFSGVFLGLSCEHDPPGGTGFYQPGFSEVLLSGVRSPFRIDSLMPGIARRYRVS